MTSISNQFLGERDFIINQQARLFTGSKMPNLRGKGK